MVDSQLKVLFLSSWYPTRDNPTMGNFVQKHAEAVAIYARVDVLHVCFSKQVSGRKETITEHCNGVNSHIIYLKKPAVNIPFIREILKLWMVIRAYNSGFKQIYQANKPDIVHSNILIPIGMIAYIFFKKKKIPYIITEHWTAYLPGDPNKPGKSMFFFRHFANKAKAIAPVTDNLAKAMQSFGIKNKFTIISNVVDTDIFSLKEKKSNLKKRILHVSSLLEVQKNFNGILSAMVHLKEKQIDFILEVISDGDFEQYRSKINESNLADNIIFHGKKNTVDVASIMKHCDMLLLFSNYENFPCVIPEAWSCGLPVLSTNVGGIAEFMNPENGVIIAPNNLEELKSELIKMLHNLDIYDSQKIRDFAVNHFSYHKIGEQFINLYQSVLKN